MGKRSRPAASPAEEAPRGPEEQQQQQGAAVAPTQSVSGNVWILKETMDCALQASCVSCLYKLLSTTAAPRAPSAAPNVRPEECPRHDRRFHARSKTTQLGFLRSSRRILTVGDGDLSFSRSVSSLLRPESSAEALVCTTYETHASLAKVYGEPALENIRALRETPNVLVKDRVDASKLATYFPDQKFDEVVFNFPCIADPARPGFDAQLQSMAENARLLEDFGAEAAQLLSDAPDARVYVSHKTKAAFSTWNVATLLSRKSDLVLETVLVFDRCVFPGYVNRKALDSKSFPVTDALTYVFKKGSGKTTGEESEKTSSVSAFLAEIAQPLSEEMVQQANEELMRVGLCKRRKKQ